jgi:PEP-CTERM motif
MKRSHANSLTVLGISAFALSLAAFGGQAAATVLPVDNLTFTEFNPGGLAPKTIFFFANAVGWTGPGPGDLVAIDAPGTATIPGSGGNSYPVAGPFADPPPGGNFIQMDGNPMFENSFNQVLTGLVAGTTYTLTFWQAAGQQTGFSGETTEQWKVFLAGAGGSFSVSCASDPCVVNKTGDIQEADSALMTTPSQGMHPWELETLMFTADAASETLSFLAWGDDGHTTNLPPTVFLAGVNSPALPEPSTWAMMGLGFLGLGSMALRRHLARRAVATA